MPAGIFCDVFFTTIFVIAVLELEILYFSVNYGKICLHRWQAFISWPYRLEAAEIQTRESFVFSLL